MSLRVQRPAPSRVGGGEGREAGKRGGVHRAGSKSRQASSGVSAASELLGKPGTYQGLRVGTHLPKTEKSADLAHHFSGVAKFCVQNKQTWNLKR